MADPTPVPSVVVTPAAAKAVLVTAGKDVVLVEAKATGFFARIRAFFAKL